MQPQPCFPSQAAMASGQHLSHHWHLTHPTPSHAKPSRAPAGQCNSSAGAAGGQCLCSDVHEHGQGGAWESSAGPHLYLAAAWYRGPCSLLEGPSPGGCAQPWAGCRTLVSDCPTQPPLPALVLVPPSPAERLLPSTSCLILSFGTFRYLLQLHTWEKREGRW